MMVALRRAFLAALAGAALAPAVLLGCDRNAEPFSDDAVEAPDLSKIFPEAAGGNAALPPVMPPPGAGAAAAGNPPAAGVLRGVVRVAPQFAGRAPRGAILFVIARSGPAGPPTAVLRLPQPRFPVRWEIGPAQRMLEGTPFVGPFALSARLDSDGNATTRGAGDLQGRAPGAHFPGDAGIEIVLGESL